MDQLVLANWWVAQLGLLGDWRHRAQLCLLPQWLDSDGFTTEDLTACAHGGALELSLEAAVPYDRHASAA
jgi:hypothetical protein